MRFEASLLDNLDPDPELLRTYRREIVAYLDEHLALELKPGMILKRVSEGADFLGYIVRPEYTLVRKRVVGNLRARLQQFERDMVQTSIRFVPSRRALIHLHLRKENVHDLRQTLASYLGHFKHADCWRLVQGIWERYAWLNDIFRVEDGHLAPRYEPGYEPTGLRAQYLWALRRYGGSCIFLQVGSYCEFYGTQALRYSPFFGLKSHSQGARITLTVKSDLHPRENRGPDAVCAGFPVRYLKGFKKKALQAGLPYVVLGEAGYYPSGLKRRVVTEIFKYSDISAMT